MLHNYIIISDDKVTIDFKINELLAKIPYNEKEIIKYDMSITPISVVLEQLNTYNLLSECKIIICYNCNFLEGENCKDIANLKECLINCSENYLIMIATKVSEKKEVKLLVEDNIEIIDTEISSESLIKKNLENYVMDNRTIKYFAEYCQNNNEKILNELCKIKLYKIGIDNVISIEDINNIVIKEYKENIFDLVNAIVKRNKNNIFKIYYRIIKQEKDVVNLIASISSQIRLLYNVKLLNEDHKSVNEIASILNVKFRAVTIALENCYNFSYKRLLYLLNELADIDYNMKSGTVSENNLFELFLLNV